MYDVSLLKSQRDGKCYLGSTNNLRERLHAHNTGNVRSTRNRTPFVLVYYEAYAAEHDARMRESQLKKRARAFAQLRPLDAGPGLGRGPSLGMSPPTCRGVVPSEAKPSRGTTQWSPGLARPSIPLGTGPEPRRRARGAPLRISHSVADAHIGVGTCG